MKKNPAMFRSLHGTICLGTVLLASANGLAQNLFVSSPGQDDAIYEITPDGTKSVFASGLDAPVGLAFEGQPLPVPEPAAGGFLCAGAGIIFLCRYPGKL